VDGLGLLSRAFVLPHFDALDGYQSGLRQLFLDACPPGRTPLGLDEDTAIVGDGERWLAFGAGAAWLPGENGTLVAHRNGDEVVLRLTERVE
jgi:hypothetical protein